MAVREKNGEAGDLLLEFTDVVHETTAKGPLTGPYMYTALLLWKRSSSEYYYMRALCEGVAFWDINIASLLAVVEKNKQNGLIIDAGQVGGPMLWVDPAVAYPKCPRGVRIAESRDSLFTKEPRLVMYGVPSVLKKFQSFFLNEVRVLEVLRHHEQHKNIVTYHGCTVRDVRKDGSGEPDLRVDSIVLDWYECSLEQRCADKTRPLDVDKVIAEISAALVYLHSIGYCHNDVNPYNIMVKADDTAVLIDFDASLPVHQPLEKTTTKGWGDDKTKTSRFKNDWLGLGLVEEYLRGELPKDVSGLE